MRLSQLFLADNIYTMAEDCMYEMLNCEMRFGQGVEC